MNNVIQQSQTGKKTRGVFCLRLVVGFLIYLLGGFPTLVFALPQDGQVVSGDASITTTGNDMVVHQTTDKLITNWQSFNIGGAESVEFKQPSASSVALNNVLGLSPSVILGSLKSNGQVFLSNGSGIIFGQSAQINVGGLLATTLSIKNDDFLAGNYNFTQDASRPLSSVINRGLIEASYVGLLAPGVENTGTIVANLGSVAMASGKAASMDFVGDGLINFAITEAVDGDVLDDEGNVIGHRVKNSGLIQADGGRVVLSAKDAGNIIQNVVNNEGIIEAHSAVERNGEIFLMGGDSGVVANSGTLDASGKDSGQTGGTVHVTGEYVGLFDNAKVDVSGDAGGGEALIGGDFQGNNEEIQNASRTYVSENAVISASATNTGDGGKVIVWADEVTRFYGSVYARGGASAGDGGFAEVSGKGSLDFQANEIDLSASNGVNGTLLLDPLNIVLISGVDSNTTGFTPGVDQTEAFADDAGLTSVFNVDAGGSFAGVTGTIELQATNDITVSNAWNLATSTGNGNVNVVLRAGNDININADITLDGTGTITLEADGNTADGAGDLNVASGVGITTANQAVNITANDIDLAGFINAGSGDVTISISTAGQIQIGDAAFCPTCDMVITGLELQNISAANLTVANTGGEIFVDNIFAANSNNIGKVILDAGGNIEFGRDALDLDSSVFNSLRVLSDAEVLVRETLTTDVGDLEITADADGDGGATDQLTIKSSSDLISAGDITLNASPSASVGIFATAEANMTAGGTITINDDFDASSLSSLAADNGIIINGDFSASSVVLDGDANSSVDGNDQVTFADGVSIEAKSNLGHLTLHKAEALGSIDFKSGGGMDLLGDLTANGAVTIDADTHVNVGTGLFTIASGAELNTNGNTLYLRTSEIDLQGTINVGASDATIEIAQDGTSKKVFLGDGSSCSNCLAISGAELQSITAGTLTIENSGKSNNIYGVTAANSANIGTVILNAESDNIFLAATTFNALTANSKREVYVGASITTTTGDIIFNADTNATGGTFDRVFFVSAPTLTSAANITLNSGVTGIGTSGNITMNAAQVITLNADASTTGVTTLNADDGINVNGDFASTKNIILDGDANGVADGNDTVTFADGVILESTGGTVTLEKSNALGAITLKAQGGLTLNDDFTSNGLTTIDADTDVALGGGLFTVASGATLNTNNNTLVVNALDIDLQGNINAGSGDVTISIAQPGVGTQGKIQLGDNTSCPTCTMQVSGAELQRITASTLTFENSGQAIFVDNITAANSDNIGTVILNSELDTLFRNNASTFNALTVNSKATVDVSASLTTDTGDMILSADTDSNGTGRIFLVFDPTLTSAGDITLNSSSGAPGIDVNSSVTMVAGGTISVNDDFNAVIDATLSADDGININGDFTAGKIISLNGDANGLADGTDIITFANGVTVEATSADMTLSRAIALGTITLLARDGITLDGDFTSNGLTTIDADTGVDFGTGTFTVASGATLNTNNNTLNIRARDIDLPGNIDVGSGDATITIAQLVVGTQGKIQLGDNTSCPTCTMQVSGAELQNITASTLTFVNDGQAIFVDNITAANSDNIGTVILNSTADTLFRNNASTFNALTVNSKATVDVDTSLTTDTGDMILNADTDATGGTDRIFFVFDPTLTSAGDIVLNSSSGSTGIKANSSVTMFANGTISLNHDFDATISATLNADDGINVNGDFTASQNIILNGDANAIADGNDTISFADGVTLQSDKGNISLNTSQALGTITVNAGNGISLAGNFFASSGMTQFNADLDAATSVGGLFSIASGTQLITNNNDLVIIARDVDLQGTIDAGSGNATIEISQPTVGTQGKIQLGDNTSCPTCAMQISGAELQNITAASLTLENSSQAIFVDNITAANSDNIGTVILNSELDTLFRNNGSTFNALTVNSKATVDVDASLTTDTGDMILNADTDSNGTGRIFFVFDPTLTSAGDIVLNSSSGAPGIDVNSSVTMVSGGTIFVNDDFNAAIDATLTADNGINISGDFTAGKIISLNGDANGLIDGSDIITFADGVTIEATSADMTLSRAVALGAITLLARDGVTLDGDFTSNGLTTINADTGVAFGTGTFKISSGATLNTNNNLLSINALDIDLQGSINAGSSDVSITVSNNGTIGLGNATGGLTLSGSEIQNISASNLIIGTTSNGNVSVDGVSAANTNNIGTVTVNSGGSISFDNNDSVFNALNLNANNDINVNTNLETDTGNFAAVADADLNSAGDFNLGTGTTLTSANDIDITGENAIINGSLVAAGTITINGVVSTGGDISILAVDGITFTNDVFNNGNITIDADTDRNGVGDFEIVAGKIIKSFDNNISITANDFIVGGLIDAGTGTLTLLSSVAGSTIGLGNAAGSIQISGAELQNMTAASLVVGSVLNSGVDVDGVTAADLVNIGSVVLGSGSDINFNNNDSTFDALNLVAGGSVNTNSASIIATGIGVSSVSGMNISTQTSSLDFINTGSGDVTINNSGAISLIGSSNSGNLSVTATGAVTQSGLLSVSGTTSIDATGYDVTLTDAGNDFTGSVSVAGINVNLTQSGALDLGASTITGNLDIATGGAVTDSGALNVAGTTNITAFGQDVTLDDAANDFGGAVTVTGANITLVDVDDITLGASTITGALAVTAADGITIDGAVSTVGFTSFNADSDGNISGNFAVTALGSLLTNNNDISIFSRDIDLQGTVNAGLGNASITISQLAVGTQGRIQLGDNTSCPTCAMQITGSELQNITASTLTLENTGQAIFVDNITAANSDNIGTVVLNSELDTLFRNNGSTFNALTVSSKATVDVSASLTTDAGDMILNADTDSNGTGRIFFVFDPTLTSAGDITLNSSSGAPGIDVNSSVTMFAAGTINVNDDFNATINATLNADDGINVNGDFIANQNIILNGDANGTADGNDTISFADGVTLQSNSGNISLNTSQALGAFAVNAGNGITLGGNFFVSSGMTEFNADFDANTSVGGVFAIASGTQLITNNNDLVIIARDIDLQGTVDAGSGNATITISQPTVGTQGKIQLGDSALCPTCAMQVSGAELQNITAATLTFENTGQAIFVDGVTAANSDNIGAMILNSERDTLFQGNDSTFNTLTVNSKAAVDVQTGITTDSGSMTLNADIDANGGALDRIQFKSTPTLTSAGDLTLNSATSGIQATGSVHMYTAGTLNVNGDFNGTSVANFNADNGINLNGDLTSTGVLTLNANANGTSDGNDTLTLADGITIEHLTGSVDFISATSALGSVTVKAANGINVNDSFTSQGVTIFDSDSDANGSGDFDVTATGSVTTNNNALFIDADDIDLLGDVNAGTSDITLTSGGSISNSGSTIIASTLTATSVTGMNLITDIDNFDFFNAYDNSIVADITINNASAIDLAGDSFGGFLSVRAGGDITQSRSMYARGANFDATGFDITLDNDLNYIVFSTTVSGHNVSIGSFIGVDFGPSTITGNLDISVSGNITDSGPISVVGKTTIDSERGFDIILDNALNDFQDSVSATSSFNGSGGNIVLTDANNIDLGTITALADFIVNAGGAVTDSGPLNITGTTTVNAAGQDVTLTDAANDFQGTVFVTGNNVSLTDTNAIEFGDSTISGTFTVDAADGITVSDVITTSGLTIFDADSDSNDSGDFNVTTTGSITTNNNLLNVNGANIEMLGDVNAGTSDITLTSTGNIRNSGSLITAAGLTTISQSGLSIFSEIDSINFTNNGTWNVQIRNFNRDLVVEGSNNSSDGTVIFAKSITQSGALNISGLAWLSTNFSGGGDIDLTHSGNTFGGRVLLRGGNVSLAAASGVDLTGNITGNLDVTAGGAITNSQSLVVDGVTTISAVGHDVTLDYVSNDFTGAVSVTGANVTLVDQNGIDLGASTTSGTFIVDAVNGITVSDAIAGFGEIYFNADSDANGTGTFLVNATGSIVTDDNALSVTANDVEILGIIDTGLAVVLLDVSDGGSIGLGNTAGDMTISGSEIENITAWQLVLGVDGTSGITVDGITAANSQNVGSVVLTSNGSIDFSGAASTFNAIFAQSSATTNVNVDLTADTGDLNIYSMGNILISANVNATGSALLSSLANVSTTGAGKITANALTVHALTGIDINTQTNDLYFTNNNSGDVTVNNTGALSLNGFNIVGDLNLTTTGAVTQSGALTVTGMTMISAIGHDVTLAYVSNDFVGEVGIDANNVSIADANSITFKASTLTGGLTVTARDGVTINGAVSTGAGSSINADSDANGSGLFSITAAGSILTNNNTLSITADDVDLQGALNAGLSDITVLVSDNGTIGLGNTAGDMTIDGSELQNIFAANLILGSTTNGNVTVDGITSANSDNIGTVTINSGGNIDFSNNDSVFNALNVHAVTDINVNTNLETDTGSFAAIADFENNTIGDFNLGAGTTLTSAIDIDITAENVNLNGDMVAGGTITINGEIFADDPIFLYAVDGIIITEDINNNESITIDADTNRDGIGDFELVGGVLIKSNDYDISITANDFIINGTIDAGTGNVILLSSVGGSIGIGEAYGNIRIDNSELQNITAGNLNIGDALNSHIRVKNVQAVDVSNISKLTLNATKAGKSVYFYGPASNLNDLTVNAANDVRVYGGLTAKDTTFNAGDDVKLWGGNYSFDSLTAVAGDDIVIYATLNTVNADYTAGDDIWLDGYQTYTGNLNATAGDDITIDWELTAATATLNAEDDVRIYGTTHFGDLTVNAGDDISVKGNHVTTGTATLTAVDDILLKDTISINNLNANAGDDIHLHGNGTGSSFSLTAGDDVHVHGTYSTGDFTATAADDVHLHGNLSVTNDGNLSAGDDIHLHGNNSFGGELNASAGDDIHFHGLLTVTGEGNLSAGDDIHLHGSNSFGGDLNADAGDDIHSKGDLTVGGDLNADAGDDIHSKGDLTVVGSSFMSAGNDIHLHGNSSFGALNASAGDDLKIHDSLTVTGNASMTAGDEINLSGTFNLGDWTAFAGDDIRLRGNYNLSTADLKANDEIRLDRATVNSGNFSAEADFDNNDAGAFKLEKHSSITSTGDVDLSGYGLKLKGSLDVAGTLSLTDKSAGNLLIHENINAGSFTINSGGNVTINSTGNITINSAITGSLEINTDGEINAQTNYNPDSGIVFQSFVVTPVVSFSTVSLGSGITGSLSSASVGLYSVASGTSPSVILGQLNFSGNNSILVNNN